MQADRAGRLRINLARWNCFSLRITTEATLTKDVCELIGLDPKRRFIRFYEQYSRSNTLHSMLLRFVRREKQENQYGIRLLYEAEETEQLSRILRTTSKTLKPSEVFVNLCHMEDSLFFRCDCSFIYKGEETYFPLPIKLEDKLFDEIRGIRLVKLQQGKILLENFIDLVEPDVMIHRIKFVHEGRCSVDLPQRLLRRARTISLNT